MRATLTILGVSAIAAYSFFGAMLMNDWAVAAASEVPLDTAISEMNAAGQQYSVTQGISFAALGITLALIWGVMNLHPKLALPTWGAVALWAGIVAMGAPAYFAASFANLNSVGDTFLDWNAGAAWALEMPLYLVSGAAFLLAAAALMTTLLRPAVVAGNGGRSDSRGS